MQQSQIYLTKNLKLSKKIPKKIDSNVYIITVGTPINCSKKVRTDMIISVSEEISSFIKEDDLIILSELKQSIQSLGNIVKPTDNEEMLDHLFKNFCIGK